MENKDSSFQQIREWLFDEEKFVTISSISSHLHIPMLEAKILLSTFIKSMADSELDKVSTAYLLAGRLKSDHSYAVYMVKDSEMQEKRALFEDSHETVYSVQNGKDVNLDLIVMSDRSNREKFPSIISDHCIRRSRKVFVPASSSSVKPKVEEQPQKLTKGKAGGLAAFLAKAPPKAKTEKRAEQVDKSELKENHSNNVEAPKEEAQREPQDNRKKSVETTRDVALKEEKTQKQSQDNSKKRKKSVKNTDAAKKRKRIQEVCDSDSSDIFGEDEDVIEKSEDDDEPPPAPPIKVTSPVPKNKKRKAVNKTFVDDEGFLVTSTEYVYESASEEEEEEEKAAVKQEKPMEVKKAKPVEPTKTTKGKNKKNAPPVKQKTLMSFFKKN